MPLGQRPPAGFRTARRICTFLFARDRYDRRHDTDDEHFDHAHRGFGPRSVHPWSAAS